MALGESLLTEDPLFGLDVALDEVGATPLGSLGPAALGLRAVALQRARNRLDAITAETLAEAENARTSVVAGQRNMSQYVAARTHCEPSAIRRDTRLGRWLWSFPELAEAFRSGVLSRRHLEDIQSVDNVRTHFMLKRDQHLFIGFVEELEWKSFKHAVKYWLDANDPDGKEPKEKVANNSCTLRTLVDGTVELKATLDPVSGAVVKNAIEAEDQRLFRRDEDNDVVRRVSHRRAEALTIVAALAMGNTAGGTPQPLVHLVM
ncbi:MAG: DUF222 domain-containing protein, partial [Acidimicrobiales bacterium]|nr:DUF222 domain-containing protein [Acidimicrobiales bacterium]